MCGLLGRRLDGLGSAMVITLLHCNAWWWHGQAKVAALGLGRGGEEAEDLGTGDLKFVLVDYYLGRLQQQGKAWTSSAGATVGVCIHPWRLTPLRA